MNNIKDFVIEGTKLIEYIGNDKEVYIPDGITTIAEDAFFNKQSVEYIFMPDTVTELESHAICCNKKLKSLKLSANLKKIQNNFHSCDSIEKVDFLENIESIIGDSFCGKQLKKVILPPSLKEITCSGFNAFTNIKNAPEKIEVSLDEKNEHLICENNCIYSSDMKILMRCFPSGKQQEFIIPDSVEVINDYAFAGCDFNQIKMTDTVKKLGRSAFADCRMEKVRLSEDLSELPIGVFDMCVNLREVNIPHNLKTIRNYAFSTTVLDEIVLPESLKIIEKDAFMCATTKIHIKKNERYETLNDCLIEKQRKEIILYFGKKPVDKSTFKGIEAIGNHAFDFADVVAELHIPNNVKFIKDCAFFSCKGLVKAHIPSSVKVINYGIFEFSTVEEITIADGVTQIKDCAFLFTDNLKKITIPESVTKIGKYAFGDDSKATIYCKENSRAHRFAKENNIKFKIK